MYLAPEQTFSYTILFYISLRRNDNICSKLAAAAAVAAPSENEKRDCDDGDLRRAARRFLSVFVARFRGTGEMQQQNRG